MEKGNLLIVDDEPLLLKRLKSNLEEYAEIVFVAADGIEALEILERETVNCVICDINMPRLNGVEVIKKLRSQDNDVPFIFYTGHGSNDLMLEAAKYGAFDFLNKPNLDGLEDVVSRGLRQGTTKEVRPSDQEFKSEFQRMLDEIDVD